MQRWTDLVSGAEDQSSEEDNVDDEISKDDISTNERYDLTDALIAAARVNAGPAIHVDKFERSILSHQSDDYGLATSSLVRLNSEREVIESQSLKLKEILYRRILRSTHSPGFEPGQRAIDIDNQKELDDIEDLEKASCNADDLELWARILTAPNSTRGVNLLLFGEKTELADADPSRVPSFVLTIFLGRQWITRCALRLIIGYIVEWAQHKVVDVPANPPRSLTGDGTLTAHDQPSLASISALPRHFPVKVEAFVGLIRHARQIWPESLEQIVTRAIALLQTELPSDDIKSRGRQRFGMALLFNHLLYQVSRPTAVEPYKSIVHQETGQALILRHMAESDPPLNLTREGYRGVLQVQLARKKTGQERGWARLKAPSWPPWKEEKTGLDALVGLEHGISRAGEVLHRMQEAGYPLRRWEQVAMIYAGWDTDSSPTVQERTIMKEFRSKHGKPYVWAARIRSTRTIQEAWACFLAHEDERSRPHQEVYLAMMEKIHFENLRKSGKRSVYQSSHHFGDSDPADPPLRLIYAGDAKEVFAPPSSAHQETYTRSKPLTVEQLLRQMVDRGVKPSGRLHAFLIANASSLEAGVSLLSAGHDIEQKGLVELLYLGQGPIDKCSPTVFAAWIQLLARFPNTTHQLPGVRVRRYHVGTWVLDMAQPIIRAYYLLIERRPLYRPAWNALFRSLAYDTGVSVSIPHHSQKGRDPFIVKFRQQLHRIVPLEMMRQSMTTMRELDLELDLEGFKSLCMVFTNAAQASRRLLVDSAALDQRKKMQKRSRSVSPTAESLLGKARELLHDGIYIRQEFDNLVGSASNGLMARDPAIESPDMVDLPRLYTTPNPAILHVYARALGATEHWRGILELLEWMKEYWPELLLRKTEDLSGDRMLRRTFVAIRAFVELGEDESSSGKGVKENAVGKLEDENGEIVPTVAPADIVSQMKDIVNSVPEWGGWPSSDEVALYIERGLARDPI